MALTGGLAAGGKSALLAMQIWQDDINAKGGLLGRPVKLIYYDDQSNPATVPGIYTKLLDVDKVDFIVSGYGTNMIAPAMPVAIQHDRLFLGLFGLAVNSEFHYPKYFSMLPTGPDPKHAFSRAVLQGRDGRRAPSRRPWRSLAADAEFPKNASEGARDIAKSPGAQDRLRQDLPAGDDRFHADRPRHPGDQSRNGVCRLLPARIRSAWCAPQPKSGSRPGIFGGGMVGLQYTSVKQQFGPKLNGIVDYDWWIPAPTMQFPGITEFLKKYQAKAPAKASTRLGWYLPPFAYANLQVLGDAIEGTKSLDQDKLADYIRSHPFKTIVGDISFGKDGEWSKPRVLEVQWQDIKSNNLDEFKDTKTEVILEPAEYRTGSVIAPYSGSGE